jgi:TatD DNase family protein
VNLLIDTHCHLDFGQFDEDLTTVIERARDHGISRIIVPAVDLPGCDRVIHLAESFEEVFAAVGVHPNSSENWQDAWLDQIRSMAGHPKVVAIGEIGLDYYRDHSPPDIQQKAFSAQLKLAAEVRLPVIIHNREASDDVLTFLKESASNNNQIKGVLHSFSGDWQTAQTALEIGFYLGFTGPITFKSADTLRSVAKRVPLNRLLVETDAPFLAPQKYRGRRNEPAYVSLVVEKLAELHDVTVAEMARITQYNAISLFGEKLGVLNGQPR